MSFIYMFDLVDFDGKGKVCASKNCDLGQTHSNFLYLICKYNQMLLQDGKFPIPEFFKDELGQLLQNVEQGGDFLEAKKKVLENCLPKVKMLAENSANEQEFVLRLNENISVSDKEFAESFKKADNNKHLEYIITFISGKLFEGISNQISKENLVENKKAKSSVYKDIIKYNSLVLTADKVKEKSYMVSDSKKMVS